MTVAVSANPAVPLIGVGRVAHTRRRPREHRFAYGGYFLMLPMRALARGEHGELAVNRSAWLSFHDRDHGDARNAAQGGALAWLDEVLAQAGITDATGEVWLQCYPRVFGYAFKPVSFWYCMDAQQQLRAVVAEVNNTFGERHCYLMDRPQWGQEVVADKVFHVSPFCQVQGRYRFRLMWAKDRCVVRVDHDDEHGPLIETHWSGELQPYTAARARHASWRYPLLTLMVTWRIHLQALRLWVKRVPFFRQPPAPADFVTRAHPPRTDP